MWGYLVISDLSQYFGAKTIIGCIVCVLVFSSLWSLKDKWGDYTSDVVYTERKEDFSTINDTIKNFSQPILNVESGYIDFGTKENEINLKDFIVEAYDVDTNENLKDKVKIYGKVNTQEYGSYNIKYVVYSSHNIKTEKIVQIIVK